MKLTVDPDIISAAADRVKATANGRVTLAILSGMLLKAEGDTLTLTGNSPDVMIECSVPAAINEPGTVVLPARRLADALSLMRGGGDVEITSDAKLMCEIKQGAKRSLKVPGMNPEEWPQSPSVDGPVSITFGEGELKEALDRVAPFMSTEESRYVLNGVFFEGAKGVLSMVAVDGKRLALVRRDSDYEGGVIVPTCAVNLLQSLAKDVPVSARVSKSCAEFTAPAWKLVTKLIDGNFPNYQQVIPSKSERKHRLAFNRDEMLKAIHFARLAISEAGYSIKLESAKSRVHVRSDSADAASASIEINGAKSDAPSFAVNPDYLRSLIQSIGDEEQEIQVVNPLTPVVIENATGLAMVSLIRLQ